MDVKDIILAASIAKGTGGGSGGGATKEYVDAQVGAVSERVDDIEDVIPSTATPQNPLATAADVSETAIISTSTTSPVTDSADGMVQGLTIYGKSEVVDGEIKSVGEEWSTVDLGTLTFILRSTDKPNYNSFTTSINNIDAFVSNSQPPKLMCGKFKSVAWSSDWQPFIMSMLSTDATSVVFTTPKTVTTVEQFQALISDVILAYQSTQGNTIAIKTDDGSGIDGTMAVFETALPLRGVSDTVRDKLICTSDVKQVETVCGEVDLGTLTWEYDKNNNQFWSSQISNALSEGWTFTVLCSKYIQNNSPFEIVSTPHIRGINGQCVYIVDPAYSDKATFITAVTGVKLVYPLATPTVTPLTDAEISALRSLRTFDITTNITISDEPDFELDYLKNSDNGRAVADIQTDLQGQIDGLKIKTLTYTGTGSSTNTITFPEIPVCIFSFVNKQRDSYGNFNWTNPFTWNSPYITIYYTGSSSGSQSSAVSYTGNTLTLTGSDAGLAMNRSDTEYYIYYI